MLALCPSEVCLHGCRFVFFYAAWPFLWMVVRALVESASRMIDVGPAPARLRAMLHGTSGWQLTMVAL
jgi:hypothetical protein